MTLYERSCQNCGGNLAELSDGKFKCEYCGSIFTSESVEKHMEELHRLFDETKREAISNARKNLYDAVSAEYISSTLVHECAMALKQHLPDDFQANFYELAIGNNPRKLAKAIRRLDVVENASAIDTMVRFLILSLQSEFVTETGDLIERAYKGSDLTKYEKFSTMLSEEAEKIDNCIYMTSYPRDVFVAYSSKDMEKVLELVEVLEEQGFSCFVAARNLRHGRGAVENYDKALREAMDNCTSFVFVSSMNSRHPGCDALKREIPYVKSVDIENSPAELRQDYAGIPHKYKKHRVEYRIQESTRPMAADRIVSEFFNGCERVYSPDEVADRLMNRPTVFDDEPEVAVEPEQQIVPNKVKYCVECKRECLEDAKFCMYCGNKTFANSTSEAKLMQKIATLENESKIPASVSVGDIIKFGKYHHSENSNGSKTDIEWQVLDVKKGRALVISKYCLDCRQFHNRKAFSTWRTCSLRAWLNNEFINYAFSESERSKILKGIVPADKNPKYLTKTGFITWDKIFLLSITETNKYFFTNSSKACRPTAYAYARGAYGNSVGCYWWLRTPGYVPNYHARVSSDGWIDEDGYSPDSSSGVRPAMWIDLSKI